MVLDYILLVLSIAMLLLGVVGCVLPVIPGPPLAWLGLLLIKLTSLSQTQWATILVLGIATAAVTIIDYMLPSWITKNMGGSRYGAWGAMLGLVVGLFLLGPIGVVIGPLLGALAGESYHNSRNEIKTNPWRSAFGSFLGLLVGTGLKLITTGVIIMVYIKGVKF